MRSFRNFAPKNDETKKFSIMKNRIFMLIAALSLCISLLAQSETTSATVIQTPHIKATEGAFAKTVLMPGDPLRAKFIAETFLENAQLITSVRNMLGYTGTYKGVPISVMGSGMGMPSIGIYSWELYKFFGVENIIRVGSAGSYKAELEVRDVVLAECAVTQSNYAFEQNGETAKTLYPNQTLNEAIRKKAAELGVNLKMAKVHSSDAFYTADSWQVIAERTGTDCVEMESFALFHNASVLGKQAATLLTISDSFVSKQKLDPEERQRSFSEMMRLALETAISSNITGIAEVSTPNAARSNGKYVENSRVIIHKDGKKYTTEGILIE